VPLAGARYYTIFKKFHQLDVKIGCLSRLGHTKMHGGGPGLLRGALDRLHLEQGKDGLLSGIVILRWQESMQILDSGSSPE